MITSTVESIDRDAAERYLNLERGNNRPFSRGHLSDLIGRQMRGEWITNGDTIRFDSAGQLRDGQHRLRMVKQTGIPIEVVVVRDIDPTAFSTMDVGKKRTLGDVLYIEKETNHVQLAGALSWVSKYLSRRLRGSGISYEEHHKVLAQHPGIRDSVVFYLKLDRPAAAPGFPGVTMSLHYLFSQADATVANDFIERYVTGLNILEATDPVGVVREQIIRYSIKPPTPASELIFALLCKAWNAHQTGQPAKKRFKLPARTPAPRITGFPKELFLESQLAFPENEEEEEE